MEYFLHSILPKKLTEEYTICNNLKTIEDEFKKLSLTYLDAGLLAQHDQLPWLASGLPSVMQYRRLFRITYSKQKSLFILFYKLNRE
jgi:hypothetical protein